MQRSELALWLALAAAFSPAIATFLRGFQEGFSPWSTLLSPVLLAICLLRGVGISGHRTSWGLLLVVAGGLLEVTGILVGIWTLTWLGLPVAVLGMALFLGRPSARVAVLAFGLVPVPVSLMVLQTPWLETRMLEVVCPVWRTLGLDLSCVGPVAKLEGRSLELGARDAGLPLAIVLGELGWFMGLCRRAPWPHALRTALASASLALVVQPAAVALAIGLLAAEDAGLARAWLDEGVWLACAMVALAVFLRPAATTRRGAGDRE